MPSMYLVVELVGMGMGMGMSHESQVMSTNPILECLYCWGKNA